MQDLKVNVAHKVTGEVVAIEYEAIATWEANGYIVVGFAL